MYIGLLKQNFIYIHVKIIDYTASEIICTFKQLQDYAMKMDGHQRDIQVVVQQLNQFSPDENTEHFLDESAKMLQVYELSFFFL